MITKVMEQVDSNRTHAARTLGITRQGLLKKIKRLGLNF
jgi:DNA-binding protein Fis